MTTTAALPETVGEIAARYPATIRVFEKNGIDFCCEVTAPVGRQNVVAHEISGLS